MVLTENDKKKLRNWCKKLFDDNKIGFDLFDFDNEIDNKVSLEENKTLLRGKIKLFFNEYSTENIANLKKSEAEGVGVAREQVEIMIQEVKQKQEQQIKLEFEKVLEKIENDKTTSILEEIYYVPKQFAKMVAMGNSKGFLLYGQAGTGKSYCVMRAFREVDKPFVLMSGHITTLELYKFLYEHKNDNIIFDDVNLLENINNLNMLKACLNDNSRIVSYHSSSNKLKIPSSFLFEGTIILLINSKQGQNEDLKAVESRILNYEMKMDYNTIIKVMFEITKKDYKTLTFEERLSIVKWIKSNTSQATKDFSLRKLFQVFEIYLYNREEWEKLARKVLIADEQVEFIVQGMRQKEWCEKTGKHRATYYRLKNQIENSIN